MILDMLAAHRLARLVTADDITADLRELVIRSAYVSVGRESEVVALWGDDGEQLQAPGFWQDVVALDATPPKLATLITCRWCTGMWLAFGIVVVRRTRWWRPLRDALALSSAAVLIARLEED